MNHESSRDHQHPDKLSRPALINPPRFTPRPIVLWRLRGSTDDLCGVVIETSFGYAFGLELDRELVLLHLQPNLESLVSYAERIESALIKQGWRVIPETVGRSH